ncbi:FtsJ-domain-containing protein [Fomitiporia mediterranea MF3/22]|uniref:FtsJ-domain-containing protein n=1 Tax=Fomitiporia mediterranea (strain MF3/22) TaxID=694068 RepID=UPI0004409573|nr:FtsJ-domain-containing protein [Fomitiporia mediterranea MF3/22]EJD00334.1 FtsJ-domain-containing protein [Fomitiporia mediterranea MF3/22]
MPSPLKDAFERDGFVIVDSLVPDAQFKELQAACARVIAKTRSGEWQHRRVLGKQFPPFDSDNPDSWGVQHIMHPDLKEPIFAKWYTGDELMGAAKSLLECGDEHLQMELFNLLINPQSHEFALRWHRDDIRENATEEEEVKALALWHHGVQWNTALYEDDCLYVVPRSHAQPRTPEQRAHSETLDAPKDPLDMPGVLQVKLKHFSSELGITTAAGQTVFYNNNILHCARYSPHSQRATLHGCVGDTRGGSTRARNVLQHGLKWMQEDRFRETLPEGRARDMLDRLLEMESREGNGKIAYSLTPFMRPSASLFAKSSSSKQWLARQARDPYVKARAASASQYRARSAFKLLELDKKYNIIKRDKTKVVVDLGAAPGGWSQVVADILGVSRAQETVTERSIAEAVEGILTDRDVDAWSTTGESFSENSGELSGEKTIIALDLLPISPIRGVRTVRQDFLAGGDALIASLLPSPDTKADVILSDIAPNMTGNKTRDEAACLEVCEAVYRFAARYLRVGGSSASEGGSLVLKHFANESTKAFYLDRLKPNFYHTYIVKPDASRDESSEYYFVSKGFKGDTMHEDTE